jgi:hypothetical protein
MARDGGLIHVDSCGAATVDGEGKKDFCPAGPDEVRSGKKRLRLG